MFHYARHKQEKENHAPPLSQPFVASLPTPRNEEKYKNCTSGALVIDLFWPGAVAMAVAVGNGALGVCRKPVAEMLGMPAVLALLAPREPRVKALEGTRLRTAICTAGARA